MNKKTKYLLVAVVVFLIGLYLEENGHLNWLKSFVEKAQEAIDSNVLKHIRKAYEELTK